MRIGFGWTILVIFFSERHFGVTFNLIFSEFGRTWGSEWERVGTTLADFLVCFFETDS